MRIQNNDNGEINFSNVFPFLFEKNPFEIIATIEGELSKLMSDELLSENTTNILVIERKGVNLFHPFFNSLLEIHNLSSINLYRKSPNARIRSSAPINGEEAILLTDAVGKGNEVTQIINLLSKKGITVFKVCGYAAKNETLKKLKTQFSHITFKFLHETEDEKSYIENLWKLTPVYHSRIEPLDSDHPFYLFLFVPKIKQSDIKKIIDSLCSDIFGNEYSIHNDDELMSNDIVGYRVESTDSNSMIKKIITKWEKDHFQMEKVQLSFRFDSSKSQLRVMAFCSPFNLDINQFKDGNADCINFISRKYCDTMEGGYPTEVMCPLCIDTNISLTLLKIVEEKISRFARGDFDVTTVRKYNSFDKI